MEVTRAIIKIPRKSARLANAQIAQPLTTVLIQEENQQQATGRKISVLTPPPEFKSEFHFPSRLFVGHLVTISFCFFFVSRIQFSSAKRAE